MAIRPSPRADEPRRVEGMKNSRSCQIALSLVLTSFLAALCPAALGIAASGDIAFSPVVRAVTASNHVDPVVASNGNSFLTVWTQGGTFAGQSTQDIYGARLSGTGALLDRRVLSMTEQRHNELEGSVAGAGSNFVVTWTHQEAGKGDIRTRLIHPDASKEPVVDVASGDTDQRGSTSAAGGGGVLVTWMEHTSVSDSDIYARRLDATDLHALDPMPIVISAGPVARYNARVTFDGTNFLIVWSEQVDATFDVKGARVSTAGTVLDPAGFVVSSATGGQYITAVVGNGNGALALWMDRRAGNDDVFGARIRVDGSVADPAGLVIAATTGREGATQAAWNGQEWLVAWQTTSSQSVVGNVARVSMAGTVSPVEATFASGDLVNPAIAANSTLAVVTWVCPAGICARRLRLSGESAGSDFFVSYSGVAQRAPVAAWNGSSFLLGWEQHGWIYAARMTTSGRITQRLRLSSGYEPAIAWNGHDWLVVWWLRQGGSGYVRGKRISASGVVRDARPIAISRGFSSPVSPRVAWGGRRFLVAWHENEDPDGEGRIRGALLDDSGTVRVRKWISDAGVYSQTRPAVAWNGRRFLVTWRDCRNDPNQCNSFPDTWRFNADIYGARLTSAGTIAGGSGFAIVTNATDQRAQSIAWNGSEFMLVWSQLPSADPGVRATDPGDIYGMRLNAYGRPAGTAFLLSSAAGSSANVTWDGARFLAVWADSRTATSAGWDVDGAHIASSGIVAEPGGVPLAAGNEDESSPRVVRGGNGRALLVFVRYVVGNVANYRAFARFVL